MVSCWGVCRGRYRGKASVGLLLSAFVGLGGWAAIKSALGRSRGQKGRPKEEVPHTKLDFSDWMPSEPLRRKIALFSAVCARILRSVSNLCVLINSTWLSLKAKEKQLNNLAFLRLLRSDVHKIGKIPFSARWAMDKAKWLTHNISCRAGNE